MTTPLEIVAEGVRPFTHLFVDLLDDRLLGLFGTVALAVDLLEELADAGLAGVVDDDDALDHLEEGAAACCTVLLGMGVCAVRTAAPADAAVVVDGFSGAAVVVCRASLRGASTGVRVVRVVAGTFARVLHAASFALVTREVYSATTFAICAREHGRIQPETLRCRGQPFLQS